MIDEDSKQQLGYTTREFPAKLNVAGTKISNSITVVVILYWVRGPGTKCSLSWVETSNRNTLVLTAKTPQEMVKPKYDDDPWNALPTFVPWHRRWKICPWPGWTEHIGLSDHPGTPLSEGDRTLDFKITVSADPNCPCAKKEVSVDMVQTLDVKKKSGKLRFKE